jgi:hypothetical protein
MPLDAHRRERTAEVVDLTRVLESPHATAHSDGGIGPAQPPAGFSRIEFSLLVLRSGVVQSSFHQNLADLWNACGLWESK